MKYPDYQKPWNRESIIMYWQKPTHWGVLKQWRGRLSLAVSINVVSDRKPVPFGLEIFRKGSSRFNTRRLFETHGIYHRGMQKQTETETDQAIIHSRDAAKPKNVSRFW